jgi:HlyD family secretion protein
MAVTSAEALEWYSDVPRSIRSQTTFGLALVVVICGGFALWGATAPLASAVIAQGSFVATGQNKVVQHLEGGIIKAIVVREGDRVVEGQDLVLLDETAALGSARQLLLRQLRLEAILVRLQAESRGLDQYVPPPSILEGLADLEIKAINDSQIENFKSARAKLLNDIEVLEESISALEFQRTGILGQIEAVEHQRNLLADELATKAKLLEEGIVTRPVVSALERGVADADGDISRLHAELQIGDAQIGKYEKEIIQISNATQQAALDEMQIVEAELDAVREQVLAAENILDRTVVRAPVSGTVVRLYYHTAGGVIESGKAIAEIIPSDVPLLIEVRIPRMQIDEVRIDQLASVRLTALNQRTTPVLDGQVIYVSADSISDGSASPDAEAYVARVSISGEQLSRVDGFIPTPGMPAEILIQTHERTFFEYIVKPVTDSMARAFRED